MSHLWDGWPQVVTNCYKKLMLSDSLCAYPSKITANTPAMTLWGDSWTQGVAGGTQIHAQTSGPPIFLIWGTLCTGHGHRSLCTHQLQTHSQISHSFPSSQTAEAHSPLHQGSPRLLLNPPFPQQSYSLWQGPWLLIHLKPSHSQLIKSSASGPNFCPWASATHLVQVWPSRTSLPPFVPQLDEVCCNITSSGSRSLTGNGPLPALPSNKVHLTLFNSSHWNLHAENYVLPTIWALKLLKFEVYVKTE